MSLNPKKSCRFRSTSGKTGACRSTTHRADNPRPYALLSLVSAASGDEHSDCFGIGDALLLEDPGR